MRTKRDYLLSFLTTVAIIGILFSWSCKKEDPVELAALTTINVTDITPNSAQSGGNITYDGGDDIIARGVCWGTSPGPTINDNITTDGTGVGSFTSNLTELSRNSNYYVRAYATNSAGTSYGNEIQFTTGGELPTVTTSDVADIGSISAIGGGNVYDDGGISVTARGVVWSSFENPTMDDNEGFTEDGTGTGVYTSDITNLMTENTYYFRAYAINSMGTAYGEQVSFATIFISGEPYADARDGNVYNTLQIGNQHWLKDNLRYLPEVYPPASNNSASEARYYVYGYEGTDISEALATDNYNNYGVLYNWTAAMNGKGSSSANPSGVQGVCPTGWHLPSDGEWTQLTNYLNDQHGIPNTNTVNGAGNALKSCRQVGSPLGGECATSEHPRWDTHTHYGTDQFKFSALPGGARGYFGDFSSVGDTGYWWSSTGYSSSTAWYRYMLFSYGSVGLGGSDKEIGYSVRCVRDL